MQMYQGDYGRYEYLDTYPPVHTGVRCESIIRDFAFFVFERTKHQPRRILRSYLILQKLSNEAALSPGIDAFWY